MINENFSEKGSFFGLRKFGFNIKVHLIICNTIIIFIFVNNTLLYSANLPDFGCLYVGF